jgi:hypothetical protein
MTLATAVYLLCALTSAACAVLLSREYRRTHTRLLLWSSLSFSAFAVTNILAFADFVVLPAIDLSILRAGTGCVAIALLLFGLIWDAD